MAECLLHFTEYVWQLVIAGCVIIEMLLVELDKAMTEGKLTMVSSYIFIMHGEINTWYTTNYVTNYETNSPQLKHTGYNTNHFPSLHAAFLAKNFLNKRFQSRRDFYMVEFRLNK